MNKGCTLRKSNCVAPLSALLLDSSLISTTFCKPQSKETIYNAKLIDCNGYLQLYTFTNDKSKNTLGLERTSLEEDEQKYKKSKADISTLDTDLLKKIDNTININNPKEIELKNIMRSKLQCQRLAKCNSEIWKTFITLTFAENITDITIANKEFNKFVYKIKRVFPDFKYLCVPEFMKNGRVHYHLLTNIDISNEKLIYRQLDNKKYLHIKYWNNGFDKVENIKGDIKKIIGYISKYMTKDIDNRLFGHKRYFYSQNLKKPIIEYLDINNPKHLDYLNKLINDKNIVYENNYVNPYNTEIVSFKEFHN